jgi:hypothetical protein
MYLLLVEETSEHGRSVVCTAATKSAWKPFARTARMFCDIQQGDV